MDSETLEPMNYGIPDVLVDFPGSELSSLDFPNTAFDSLNYEKMEPACPEPGTVELTSLQCASVGGHSMEFDTANSGSTDSGDVNFSGDAWAIMDSGVSGLYDMGFCSLELETTHALIAASDTADPVTIAGQSMNLGKTDANRLNSNNMDFTVTNYDLIGSYNLNPGTEGTDNLEGQEIESSSQEWQTSTTGQRNRTSNGVYDLQHSQTPFLHPTSLKQASFRGIPAAKKKRSDIWKEYQPKSLDKFTTRVKITADDWEDHRPLIKQLYLVENVKLKDVMQIMEIRSGFVATKKMYKTKIEQWGLKKNYNAAEKERFARIVKAHRDSGRGVPPLTLRNRAVKMDRVRRFCKQRRILEEICDALPAQSASKGTNLSQKAPADNRLAVTGVLAGAIEGVGNSSLSLMLSSEKMSFDPERPFSTTSRDGRIELILFQTKIYHKSLDANVINLNELDGCTILTQSEANLQIWQEKLVYGMWLLRQQKSTEGWPMIHEACEMTSQILDQPPQSFFRFLLNTFDDHNLASCPDLRAHILQFFTKASAATLGCNHPISVVSYHLQEQQILADVVKIAFEVLMDVVGENAEPTNPEVWSLRDFYCRALALRGEWAAAESYGQRFLKQCEEIFGRVHWRTRRLLFNIGEIYYVQGLHELAEREFQDLLQRGRKDLGAQYPGWIDISALRILAWIWEGRGDFTQSEEYWRQVLAGAIKECGVENDATICFFVNIEQSFKDQGKDPEAWLQQKFGLSCI